MTAIPIDDNHQPLRPNGQGTVNVGHLSQITDLIYPQIRWEDDDYTNLKIRLDMYEHFAMLTSFKGGKPDGTQYVVDPISMAAALGNISLTSGLLPANTLFWGRRHNADRLAIYIAPKVHFVPIRDELQAWRVPMPGLVFIGHEYHYSCFALKEEPSSLNLPLFHAPCPNVHPEGVCRGNAPFPRAHPSTIWRAVEVFFGSKFNKDLGQHKSRKYPANILDMWRMLDEDEEKTYPLDDLLPANITLGRLANAQS